jgi:hypothetical protein
MRAFMFVPLALVAAGPLANVASAETVLTTISGTSRPMWITHGLFPTFEIQFEDGWFGGNYPVDPTMLGIPRIRRDEDIAPRRATYTLDEVGRLDRGAWIVGGWASNDSAHGSRWSDLIYVSELWQSGLLLRTDAAPITVESHVDVPVGATLAGTAYHLTAIRSTVTNLVYTQLGEPGFEADYAAYDFQVDFLGTVPEPESLLLVTLALTSLTWWCPRRHTRPGR